MRVIVGQPDDPSGRAIEWSGERPLSIGRAATADIRVTDARAADQHVRLELHGGLVYAIDPSGVGAIEVNGTPTIRQPIDLGDTVSFGEASWLRLQDGGETIAVRVRPSRTAPTDPEALARVRAAAATVRDTRAPGLVEAPARPPLPERLTEPIRTADAPGDTAALTPAQAAALRTDMTQQIARPAPRAQPAPAVDEKKPDPPRASTDEAPPAPAPEGGDTAIVPRPGADTLELPRPPGPLPHPPHQRWVEGFWVDEGLLPAPSAPPHRGFVRRAGRWFFARRRRG